MQTEGTVKRVKATCLFQNQRVKNKRDQKRLCSFKVKVNQKGSNAKVWVTPRCATQLKARVQIVIKVPGEGRDIWSRTWKVRTDSSNRCSLSGNG